MYDQKESHVPDEERRELLKALGITGSVAVGGATLEELQEATSAETANELAPIGQAIQADLAGELDAELITDQQAEIANTAARLPAASEKGLPEDNPRQEFTAVATAAEPIYDHLADVGFFESTTEHLPDFTPTYLESAIQEFVGSESLSVQLSELSLSDVEGVDMLATVIANAEELDAHHWVATDEIPRGQLEFGEFIPPVTMAAAGGALLWLRDIDSHLWQKKTILTEDILDKAIWHSQSMAAGFSLMSEGAKVLAKNSESVTESELTALLSTGFAVQAIAQEVLPQEVYWVTEDMRSSYRSDLQTITTDQQ